MRILFVAIACGLAVAGCAKDANQLGATYVSASDYQNYTCPELAEEASRVSADAVQAGGGDYTGDSIAWDVGRTVFLPVLIFQKGYYKDPAELARLKRSMEALEQVSIQKNCGITFQHIPSPPPPQVHTRRSGH